MWATPKCDATNSSGSVLRGAALTCASFGTPEAAAIGALAVTAAMINVIGGYLVTDRMLKKFQKKD